jgi:hypothetical protein
MPLFCGWLIAFSITIVSELAIAVPVLAKGGSRSRRVAAVCLAQLCTHPSVWFVWPLLGLPRPLFLLVAEGFALLVETSIYRFSFERLAWSRCFAASALANGSSVLIGLLLPHPG